MGRLQDFPPVTPTSSDKILIVQSQGQGLAPHTIKMDSANPTGTGSLSINRASGSTVGTNSATVGNGNTASGESSFAEGRLTTASGTRAHAEGSATTASGSCSHAENAGTISSGDYSHAEGYVTIANHLGQHVFGVANIADASTAAATSKGNYIEIVGNGSNNANRSNARTLDWSGNEVLAGDLTIYGNLSIGTELNNAMKSNHIAITSGNSQTVNEVSKCLIFSSHSNDASLKGIYMRIGATILPIISASGLTVTATNSAITISNTSGSTANLFIIKNM